MRTAADGVTYWIYFSILGKSHFLNERALLGTQVPPPKAVQWLNCRHKARKDDRRQLELSEIASRFVWNQIGWMNLFVLFSF